MMAVGGVVALLRNCISAVSSDSKCTASNNLKGDNVNGCRSSHGFGSCASSEGICSAKQNSFCKRCTIKWMAVDTAMMLAMARSNNQLVVIMAVETVVASTMDPAQRALTATAQKKEILQ